jgi:tetratricopeptide (TPR) repeat protein
MRRVACAVALLVAGAWAGPGKSPWIEVATPHFHVFCDGGKGDTRNVALQMERMRAVFRQAFSGLNVDPPSPIDVLAVRNGKEMRAVEPAAYLGKGTLTLGGYFQRTPDHDLILLRLSAPDTAHPYRVIYHEYTHLITSRGKVPLPLWLSEGLAEFYESTVIRGNDVALGKPERFNIDLLRRQQLIPLPALFAVDQASPYYHEQNKGTIFYAESWALTHYFMFRQRRRHSQELQDYLRYVRQGQSSVAAATRAFGDLAALQKRLQGYINQLSLQYVHEKLKININPKRFTLTPLPVAQADAVRGEFLAWNGRYADATRLLHAVLREEPGNARALASLGYIAYQQQRLPAAAQWFSRAAAHAPGDFLDQYFSGMLLARQMPLPPGPAAQAVANLQAAIRLNPAFAPAYDTLAVLYADQRQHLAQADRLELQAISLDPASFRYRFNTAGILVGLQRDQDAIAVLQAALPRAVTPQERQECEQRIAATRQYLQRQAALRKAEAQEKAYLARNEAQPGLPADADAGPTLTVRPAGVTQTLAGTIHAVRCGDHPSQSMFSMAVDLASGGKTVTLHAANYLRVRFKASNFTPQGVLNPCSQLLGMKAAITTVGGQITTILLSR